MESKLSKSQSTRRHIIKAAAPIFNMYGYAGTSMSQLTEAIGMTKGAIYGNFKDKDEIAIAAFDHNVSTIFEKIMFGVAEEKNANDQLIAYANFTLDHFPELLKIGGCPVLSMAADADFAHPELKKRAAQAIESMLDFLAGIISTGINNKQIHQHVKPEQYATVFGSLIEGGLLLAQTTGNSLYLARNVERIVHIVNTELRT